MQRHDQKESSPSGLRFLSTRLFAFAGYASPPTIYDAMKFYLPPFAFVTSRVVRVQSLMMELWSPNSSLHAYYPGLSDENVGLGVELDPAQRRSDGHLGRFDYTVGPQHYDENRPWLGFIKRRSFDSSPENVTLMDVWKSSSLPNYGYFKPTFVNLVNLHYSRLLLTANHLEAPLLNDPDVIGRRPVHLVPNRSTALSTTMTLDDAVDTLASVQRDMKELDAWNRMTESLRLNHGSPDTITAVPMADDSLIGVWLNGCTENTGIWLLRNRIPCYIIHESNGESDWSRLTSNPIQCVMMNARTDHFEFERRARTYERELLKCGQTLESLPLDIGILPYSKGIRSMQCDRARSSSFSQGWSNQQYCDPRSSRTLDAMDVPLPEQDGKIMPPAVQPVSKGSWTHWVEEEEEGIPRHLRLRSKSYKGDWGEYEYYDRLLRRHIYLDDPLDIPRHYDADPKVFGVPGPSLPFWSFDVNGKRSEHSKTIWVYEIEKPRPGEAGKEYVIEEVQKPPPRTLDEHSDSLVSSGAEDDYPITYDNQAPLATEVTMTDMTRATKESYREKSTSFPEEIREMERKEIQNSSDSKNLHHPRRERSPERRELSRQNYTRESRYYASERYRGMQEDRRRFQSSRRRSNSRHYEPPSEFRRSRSRSRSRSRYRSPPPLRYSSSPSRIPSSSRGYPNPPKRSTPSPPRSSRNQAFVTTYARRSRSPLTSRDRMTMQRSRSSSTDLVRTNGTDNLASTSTQKGTSSQAIVGTNSERALVIGNPMSNAMVLPNNISEDVLAMFPVPEVAPVPTQKRISSGITKFLVIWNLPVLLCWNAVLEQILKIVAECAKSKVRLMKVYRTNEMGYQIFWLAFKQPEHAQSFRGRANDRVTDENWLIKCDFVTEEEFSTVAGTCVDKWHAASGYLPGTDPMAIFPTDSRGYLSVPSLAARLGITGLNFAPKPPKKLRGNRAGKSRKFLTRSPDEGAL